VLVVKYPVYKHHWLKRVSNGEEGDSQHNSNKLEIRECMETETFHFVKLKVKCKLKCENVTSCCDFLEDRDLKIGIKGLKRVGSSEERGERGFKK
jgi:hypothetical protein